MIKFLGLGKKKEPEKMQVPPTPSGKGFVPVDKVKQLSAKGFSEKEIIDVLRKEGFSAEEIDRALTQALRLSAVGEERTPQRMPTLSDLQREQSAELYGQDYGEDMPPMEEQFTPFQQFSQMPPPPTQDYGTEEIVESIVQERMTEFDHKLVEFKTKYSDLERKITDLHHQLTILSKGRDQRDQSIIAKIELYKDILEDIDARLSSLEKAFKDALPALIESVRSLTDLVQRFKREG